MIVMDDKIQAISGSSKATEDQAEYQRKVDEIDKLIADGRKFALSQSYEEAVEIFSKALETATSFFGAFSRECYEPHLQYGKALIELSHIQARELKAPIEEDEEEEEENDDENGVSVVKGENGLETTDGEKAEIQPTENEEKTENGQNGIGHEDGKNEESQAEEQNSPADMTLDNAGAEQMEEDDEEDKEDVQLAWEVLEVARKICEKEEQSDSDTNFWLERKSDVLLTLGECMSVGENFDQALQEFENALEIQKKIFLPTDRRIVETHCWIGITQKNMNEYIMAAEAFDRAKGVLWQAIAQREEELAAASGNKSVIKEVSDELEKLKGLVKDVVEYIQDARESAEMREKQLAETKAKMIPFIRMFASKGADNKLEADDVTSQVVRKSQKRQMDSMAEDAEKKLNVSGGENNASTTAEETNGHNSSDATNGGEPKRAKLDSAAAVAENGEQQKDEA